MRYLKKALKFIVTALLFCAVFAIVDILTGKEMDYADSIMKSVLAVCGMYIFKVLEKAYNRYNR